MDSTDSTSSHTPGSPTTPYSARTPVENIELIRTKEELDTILKDSNPSVFREQTLVIRPRNHIEAINILNYLVEAETKIINPANFVLNLRNKSMAQKDVDLILRALLNSAIPKLSLGNDNGVGDSNVFSIEGILKIIDFLKTPKNPLTELDMTGLQGIKSFTGYFHQPLLNRHCRLEVIKMEGINDQKVVVDGQEITYVEYAISERRRQLSPSASIVLSSSNKAPSSHEAAASSQSFR